jgi:ABC-2 type transport system permease protein
MLLLEILTDPPWATILGGYLGLLLMSSAFVSLGLLASSLTENQIIAAATAFGALLLLWIIGWSESLVGPILGSFLKYLSLFTHYDNFAKGILDSRDVLFYFLFILLFLFATLRILESRQWRG